MHNFTSQFYLDTGNCFRVLPFGLSLSPRIFMKVAEDALSPLQEKGIQVLNYLDNCPILAHSQDLLCENRDVVLQHLNQLGLWVNFEKSKLSPVQSSVWSWTT